jgi:hypothetical protein
MPTFAYNTLNDIANWVASSIKAYQPLIDFCNDTYDKNITIYSGMDMLNPPQSDTAPFTILYRDVTNLGQAVKSSSYVLTVQTAIEDPTIDDTDMQIIKYLGEENITSLSMLIYDAIRLSAPSGVCVEEMEFAFDNSQFPLYQSIGVITIRIPTVIGGQIKFSN